MVVLSRFDIGSPGLLVGRESLVHGESGNGVTICLIRGRVGEEIAYTVEEWGG